MDALSLLKQQHRHVEQLFVKAKSAEGDEKEDLFLQLADELTTHASIEERVFYPAVISDDGDEEMEKAVQEHMQMRRILADMLDMETVAERFDASMAVLELEVQHHVSEEEDALFRKVAREFGKDVLEKLGREMEHLALILRESEPHQSEIDGTPQLDQR
jgi:iron-sulfur cluster repair protein YtfE (RIC family)